MKAKKIIFDGQQNKCPWCFTVLERVLFECKVIVNGRCDLEGNDWNRTDEEYGKEKFYCPTCNNPLRLN